MSEYVILANKKAIKKVTGNIYIPIDKDNSEYKNYLDWIKKGGVASIELDPNTVPLKLIDAVIKKIDANTTALIAKGFIFRTKIFSLSDNAQMNWNALYTRMKGGSLKLPFELTTKNDESFILTQPDAEEFFTSAFNTVAQHIKSGRDLKLHVKTMTDANQIKNWKDPRI